MQRDILGRGVSEEVIVAVVTSQWQKDNVFLTRFIRINSVHEEITKMIKKLKPEATGDEGFTLC